jgi:hypothetical protein
MEPCHDIPLLRRSAPGLGRRCHDIDIERGSDHRQVQRQRGLSRMTKKEVGWRKSIGKLPADSPSLLLVHAFYLSTPSSEKGEASAGRDSIRTMFVTTVGPQRRL